MLVDSHAAEADGATEVAVHVYLLDKDGTPHEGEQVNLLIISGDANIIQPRDATDSQGHTAGALVSHSAGTVEIAAEVVLKDKKLATSATGAANFKISQRATVKHIRMQVSPQEDTVDHQKPRTIEVFVTDQTGKLLAGQEITLSAQRQADRLSSSGGMTDEQGRFVSSVTSTLAGTPIIAASAIGAAMATATVQFTPGAPDANHTFLLMPGGSIVAADGLNSEDIMVSVGDQFGNLVPYTWVNMATDDSNVIIDPAAGLSDSSSIFHSRFFSTELGNVTISANAGQVELQKHIVLAPGPANPIRSTLSVEPNTVVANGINTIVGTLLLRDAAGHLRVGDQVTWSTDHQSDTIMTNDSYSDEPNDYVGILSSTVSGLRTLKVVSGNFTLTTPVFFVPANPSSSTSTIALNAQQTTASSVAGPELVVTVRDGFSNVIAGQQVRLSSSSLGIEFNPSLGTTDNFGQFHAAITATRQGLLDINASFGSVSIGDTIEVFAGRPDVSKTTFTASPRLTIADGVSACVLAVEVRDSYGNPVEGQPVTFTQDNGPSLFGQPNKTSGTGQIKATLSSTKAENKLIAAHIGDILLTAQVVFSAGEPNQTNSNLTLSPSVVVADDKSPITLSVHVGDTYANPIGGAAVSLTSNVSSDTFNPSGGQLAADGTFVSLLTGSVAGQRHIHATVSAVDLQAEAVLLPGIISTDASTLIFEPPTVVADGNSLAKVTVTLVDAHANPIANQTVRIGGPGTGVLFSSSSTTTDGSTSEISGSTDASGQLTVWARATVASNHTVVASASGSEIISIFETLHGAISASSSNFVFNPPQLVAGQQTEITVMAKDTLGNPIYGALVEVSSSLNGTNTLLSPNSGITDANGIFQLFFNTTLAGSQNIAAQLQLQDGTPAIFLNENVKVNASAPSQKNSFISVDSGAFLADGNTSANIVVGILDAFDNPVAEIPLSLAVSGYINTLSPNTGLTAADGTFSAKLTSLFAQQKTITASAAGISIFSSTTFHPGLLDSNLTSFVAMPNQIVADGTTSSTLRFLARDPYYSLLANIPVVFSSDSNDLVLSPLSADTGLIGRILVNASTSVAGDKKVYAQTGNLVFEVGIKAIPDEPGLSRSQLVVSPNTMVADGVSKAVLIAYVYDDQGNPEPNIAIHFTAPLTTIDTPDSLTDAVGRASTQISTSIAGTRILHATANALELVTPWVVVPDAPVPALSSLISQSSATPADGVSGALVALVLRDANGNPTPNQIIYFSSNDPNVTFVPPQMTTDARGRARTRVTSQTSGLISISASFEGPQGTPLTLSGNVSFVASDENTTLLALVCKPNTIYCGGTEQSLVTASLMDGRGVPLAGKKITFGGFDGNDRFIPLANVTDSNGQVSGYFSSDHAETVILSANFNQTLASSAIYILPGDASPTVSTFFASPNQLTADGQTTTTLVLTLRDSFGNALGAKPVSFVTNLPGVVLSSSSSTTDANGSASTVAYSTASGATTISAQVGTVTLSTDILFIPGSADATLSTLTAAPPAVVADGNESIVITVAGQDSLGNALQGANVVISGAGAAINGLPAKGKLDTHGVWSVALTSLTAQTHHITALLAGDPLTTSIQFLPGAPSLTHSAMVATPLSAVADGNSPIVLTLHLLDINNNPVPNMPVNVGPLPPNTLLQTPSNTTGPNGTWSATLVSKIAGALPLYVEAGNIKISTQPYFIAGSTSALASTLSSSQATALANGVEAIELVLMLADNLGNAKSGVPVVLSSASGKVLFSPAVGTTDANGKFVVHATNTMAENSLVYANFSGQKKCIALGWTPGPINQTTSAITLSPQQVIADGTSQTTIRLLARDVFNNPIVNQPITLCVNGNSNIYKRDNLTTDSSGLCTVMLSSTVAQNKKITATIDAVRLSAMASFIAGPMSSTTSKIIISSTTTVASGGLPVKAVLIAKDELGNPLVDKFVALSMSGNGVVLSPTTGITDANGCFVSYVGSTLAEDKTIIAVVSGSSVSADINFVAGPPSASRSLVSVSPNAVLADNSSLALVQLFLRDAQNNPVRNFPVSYTVDGTGNLLKLNSGVTNERGQWTTSFASAVAEPKDVSIVAGDLSLGATVIFIPGEASPSASVFCINPNTVTADNLSSAGVKIHVFDALGNPVPNTPIGIVGSDVHAIPSTGTTDEYGLWTSKLISSIAGPRAVVAQIAGTSLQANMIFVAGSPDPMTSQIYASPVQNIADGNSTISLNIIAFDAFYNRVEGQPVTWSSTGSQNTFSATKQLTLIDGTAKTFLKSTKSQVKTITATIGDTALSTDVSFVPGNVSSQASTLTATPSSPVADGISPSQIVFTLADELGNPIAEQQVDLSISGSANIPQDFSGITGEDGTVGFNLSSTKAEVKLIVGQAQGVTLTLPVNFTAGLPSELNSQWSASPNVVVANGVASISLSLSSKDMYNNVTPNISVNITSPQKDIQLSSLSGLTDSAGLFSITARSMVAQQQDIQASFAGIQKHNKVSFIAGPLNSTASTLLLTPDHVLADGNSTALITLSAHDLYGNALSGASVTLSSSGGSTDLFTPNAQQLDPDGNLYVYLTSTTAGTRTISANIGSGSLSSKIVFYPGPISLTRSFLTISPSAVTADDTSAAAITFTASDAFGNPVANQTVVFSGSGSSNNFGNAFAITNQTGRASTPLTSTAAEKKLITASFNTGSVSDYVIFIPGAPNTLTSSVVISPNQIIANGQSQALATIFLKDAQGNPIENRAVSLSLSGNRNILANNTGFVDYFGQFTTTLASSKAEKKTLVVTTSGMSLSAQACFIAGSPNNQSTTLVISPNQVTAGDSNNAVMTLFVGDSQANPVSNQPVSFSSSVASDYVMPPSGTTDANGLIMVQIIPSLAGQRSLTAHLVSISTSTSLQVLAGSPNTNMSSLNFSPNQLTADGSSQGVLIFALRDTYGNAIKNSPVTFGYDGPFMSMAPSTSLTNASGFATSLVSSTIASTHVLMATSGNVSLNIPMLFVAGSISNAASSLSLSSNSQIADGIASINVTVHVRDAYSNPVNNVPIILSSSGSTDGFYPLSGMSNTSGDFTASWATTQAGAKLIYANAGTTTLSSSATFSAGSADPNMSSLVLSPNIIVADKVALCTAQLQIRDRYGNFVGGQNSAWSTTGNQILLSSATTFTDAQGNASIQASSGLAQNAQVTASLGNTLLSSTLVLIAGQANSASSSVVATPDSNIIANNLSSAQIKACIRDIFGNPIANAAVVFSSSGSFNFFNPVVSTTNSLGVATSLLRSTRAEIKTITINSVGATSSTQATFVAGDPCANASTLTVSPNQVTANGVQYVNISLISRDLYGNVTPNIGVAFAALTPSSQVGPTAATTDIAGLATSKVTSTLATMQGVTATFYGQSLTANVVFIPGPPSSTTSTVIATPNSLITADNANFSTLVVTVRDAFGNPVPNQNIVWSTDNTRAVVTPDKALTSSLGTASTTMKSTLSGNILGSASFSSASASTSVGFIAGVPSSAKTSVSASPSLGIVADNIAYSTLTAIVADMYGNLVGNQNVIFSADGTNNILVNASNSTNMSGQASAILYSTRAEIKNVTVVANTAVATSLVKFVAGSPNATLSTLAVSPNSNVVADLVSQAVATIVAVDTYGNLVGGANVSLAATGAANGWIPAATGITGPEGSWSSALISSVAETKNIAATIQGFNLFKPVVFVNGPVSATTSTIALTPNAVVAGGNTLIQVTLRDVFNNVCPNQTVLVGLNTSGTLASPTVMTNASGVATTSATGLTLAGSSLVVASSGLQNISTSATVSPNAVTQMTLSGLKSLPSGTANTGTVSFMDVYGNINSAVSSTISFTSSDPDAILPAPYTFSAADGGQKTFSYQTALVGLGTQWVKASSSVPALTSTQNFLLVTKPTVDPYFVIVSGSSPNYALTLTGGDSTAGTSLTQRMWTSRLSQMFSFSSDKTLRVQNQCVEVPNDNYVPGQILNIQSCSLATKQRWYRQENAIVSMGNPNYCVEFRQVGSVSTDTATAALALNLCTNPNTQLANFIPASPATVFFVNGTPWSMDVARGAYVAGTVVRTYFYTGQPAPILTVNDEIAFPNNTCLAPSGAFSLLQGTLLGLKACDGTDIQKWTIVGSTIRPKTNLSLVIDTDIGVGSTLSLAVNGFGNAPNFAPMQVSSLTDLRSASIANPNMCIQSSTNSGSDGGNIGLAPCNHGTKQLMTVRETSLTNGNYYAALNFTAVSSPSVVLGYTPVTPANGDPATTYSFSNTRGNQSKTLVATSATSVFSIGQALQSAKCMGLVSPTSQGGVVLADCLTSNQEQKYFFGPISFAIGSAAVPSQCLTVSDTNSLPFSKIVYRFCAGSPDQLFISPYPSGSQPGTLFGPIFYRGLCLDATNSAASGAELYLAPCTGSLSQRWNLSMSNGPLLSLAGTCVDAGAASLGAVAKTIACPSTSAANMSQLTY